MCENWILRKKYKSRLQTTNFIANLDLEEGNKDNLDLTDVKFESFR